MKNIKVILGKLYMSSMAALSSLPKNGTSDLNGLILTAGILSFVGFPVLLVITCYALFLKSDWLVVLLFLLK